jgi:hypothetical protein
VPQSQRISQKSHFSSENFTNLLVKSARVSGRRHSPDKCDWRSVLAAGRDCSRDGQLSLHDGVRSAILKLPNATCLLAQRDIMVQSAMLQTCEWCWKMESSTGEVSRRDATCGSMASSLTNRLSRDAYRQ